VLIGAGFLVAASPVVLAGHGWWALALVLGAGLLLWCGARLRPHTSSDPLHHFHDARLGLQLTGIGLGLFLTALLGFFGLVLLVFGAYAQAPVLALAGLGLLAAGPLILSASYVFIRR
jgi:hypothetical protein